MSHGYPGRIAVFALLDQKTPGRGWDVAAHRVITQLVHHIETEGIANASMFCGLAGVHFAVLCASQGKKRYGQLLRDIGGLLVERVRKEYLLPWSTYVDRDGGVSARAWDLITGLSGILCTTIGGS